MFIREVKKQRNKASKTFYQYNLVQTTRVDGKVKQRIVLYLGSDPLLQDKNNRKIVTDVLKAKIFKQEKLLPTSPAQHLLNLSTEYYNKYLVKYGEESGSGAILPQNSDNIDYEEVDVKNMQVNEVRLYGAENLCKQVLSKLQLKECLMGLGMSSEQATKAMICVVSRAIYSSSEHKTAQILDMNSELGAIYNYNDIITHKQLYSVSDSLLGHKKDIDEFLYNRITDMFDLEDKLVIFDISNTYFETSKRTSKLAKHGRSKEKRNDCPVVVFTGVVNSQGFIRHSRIYEGNKADTATLSDMLSDLKQHASTSAKQTVVMDAGIATEENLKLVQEAGLKYVCVSRKRLKEYPAAEQENKTVQLTDRNKNKVELAVFNPVGYDDTWMYVQSDAKREKETSMDTKLKARFEEDLTTIKNALNTKGGTKKSQKVWERIGRAKEKHNRVSGRFELKLSEKDGKVITMEWKENPRQEQKDKSEGVYFIRTNYDNPNENELWSIYNTIREVESTFRCLKSDLHIRPVYHQKDERIEAHIYLTILAYQLVNTIRHMLKEKGINYDWKNIIRIMATQTIQTIELPMKKKAVHIRKPSKPINEVMEIYRAAKCTDIQKQTKKYVVYH